MDPWENERSYLLESKDELGRAVYEGALIFHEIEFRARVNPQNSGKYLYRGRVSAISPADGFVVQVRGREAIRRLGGPRVTGPGEKKKRDKKLNLTSEVYIQSGACEKVKEAVLKTARNMYAKHATMLAGELQKSVRPGSITPGVAAELYAGDFIATNYKNVKEETAKKYTKKIKDAFAELPSLPMSEYKQTMVASFLGKQKIGKDTQRMISDFWEFLVLKNYVEGVNPFPPIKQKKLSPAKKQQRAQQLSELSLARQDSLYTHIMKKPINGGIAAWRC